MARKVNACIVWNTDKPWVMDAIRYRDGTYRDAARDGPILAVEHHLLLPKMRKEVEDRGWLKTRDATRLGWIRPDLEKNRVLYRP